MLSLDTEMAWGTLHNRGFGTRAHLFDGTRDVVRRLLALHEEFEIEATWATVGALFLDGYKPAAEGIHADVKHPELIRPNYSWLKDDWLDPVPNGDIYSAPHWYGADLVREIADCRTPQEIASHTFSHLLVDAEGCSRESFDTDLKACVSVAKDWGIELKSLVFPRNGIAHLDVPKANGFTSFRGNVSAPWQNWFPGPLGRAARGFQWTLPVPPLTTRPRIVEGMWDFPATTLYLHREGFAGRIPVGFRVDRVKRGIRQAINRGELFHLYFHPFNLATDPDRLLNGLRKIYRVVADERDKGRLENLTMEQHADVLGTPEAA